jgi:hypothetical protein
VIPDIDAIERQLWPKGANQDVWMIVDPARDQKIYWHVANSHLVSSCLYSGDLPFELESVAPHLVQLEFGDSSTRTLIERAWGDSWAVFAISDVGLKRLRRHLRTLLMVKDWRGKQLLFRYYDPRVLRVYLPTCTADELGTFFGPIQRFFVENASGESLLKFDLTRGGLKTSEIQVTSVSPQDALSLRQGSPR